MDLGRNSSFFYSKR